MKHVTAVRVRPILSKATTIANLCRLPLLLPVLDLRHKDNIHLIHVLMGTWTRGMGTGGMILGAGTDLDLLLRSIISPYNSNNSSLIALPLKLSNSTMEVMTGIR